MNTDNIRDDLDALKNGVASLIADREALTELRYLLEPYREDYHPPGTEKNRRETDRELVGRIGSRAAAFPRERTDALLADREALLALRKVLDGYRRTIETPSGVGLVRHETDYEVIVRLATTRTIVSEFVVDETGRPIGRIVGSTLGMKYMVQTDDAHGRTYAKGFWNGLSSTEGRDGAVIGTPSYDRNGAKVGSDSFGSGGVQSWGSVRPAMPSTPKPEPLTDQRRHELRDAGWDAFGVGKSRSTAPGDVSHEAFEAWLAGWDAHQAAVAFRRAAKQMACPETPAPKPIRLHCGQVWRHKDGSESMIGNALRPSCGMYVGDGEWRMVGHDVPMFVNADWTVRDANGWVCVWGPGAPPFDMRTL